MRWGLPESRAVAPEGHAGGCRCRDARDDLLSLSCNQCPTGEWLAVGRDDRGRLVELVYQYDEEDDFFFVFHGMTPPTGKTLRELGLER